MKEHEFWRDPVEGGVIAVELEDGIVTGCTDPLDMSELDEAFLDSFEYSVERAALVEQHRDEFEVYETRTPYSL